MSNVMNDRRIRARLIERGLLRPATALGPIRVKADPRCVQQGRREHATKADKALAILRAACRRGFEVRV